MNDFRYYKIRNLIPTWLFIKKYWLHIFFILASGFFIFLLIRIHSEGLVIDNFVDDFADYLKEFGVTFLAVLSAFSLELVLKKGRLLLVLFALMFGFLFSCTLYVGSEYWTDCLKTVVVKSNEKVSKTLPDVPQPTPAVSGQKTPNDPNAQIIIRKSAK